MFLQMEKQKENKSSGNSATIKESLMTSSYSANKYLQKKAHTRTGSYLSGELGYKAPIVNNTGLPSQLKSGMEQTTGYDLSHVQVHYNSPKPATVQAHAYAQGSEIHLGAGQERHLPHELGHVVQQMSGMVKPTIQYAGMKINDDPRLEHHADQLAAKALSIPMRLKRNERIQDSSFAPLSSPIQRSIYMTDSLKDNLERESKETQVRRKKAYGLKDIDKILKDTKTTPITVLAKDVDKQDYDDKKIDTKNMRFGTAQNVLANHLWYPMMRSEERWSRFLFALFRKPKTKTTLSNGWNRHLSKGLMKYTSEFDTNEFESTSLLEVLTKIVKEFDKEYAISSDDIRKWEISGQGRSLRRITVLGVLEQYGNTDIKIRKAYKIALIYASKDWSDEKSGTVEDPNGRKIDIDVANYLVQQKAIDDSIKWLKGVRFINGLGAIVNFVGGAFSWGQLKSGLSAGIGMIDKAVTASMTIDKLTFEKVSIYLLQISDAMKLGDIDEQKINSAMNEYYENQNKESKNVDLNTRLKEYTYEEVNITSDNYKWIIVRGEYGMYSIQMENGKYFYNVKPGKVYEVLVKNEKVTGIKDKETGNPIESWKDNKYYVENN